MKSRTFWKYALLTLSIVSLSACDFSFGFGISTSIDYGDEPLAKPESILTYEYRDINGSLGMNNVPATGELDLLVVPVELSDYAFDAKTLSDIELAFSGNTESDPLYWESVSSFYRKSSYGKLDIHFEISSVYEAGMSAQSFRDLHHESDAADVLPLVADWYKSENGSDSLKRFDNDGDGYVDGIIMIYSCPDRDNDWKIKRFDNDGFYWAYTYWNIDNGPSKRDPSASLFLWASYDFMYMAPESQLVDAHTYIHEFGHMLGLDDYYPSSKRGFNAAGGWEMMDENILDHSAFSKAALGWTTPYIAQSDCQFTLKPFESSGECVLVPSSSWNGTPFGEYMLIEFYAPTGLNELDSQFAFTNRDRGYSVYGVKIYHIDARILKATYRGGNYQYSYYYGTAFDSASASYMVAASNYLKNPAYCNVDYSLVHLMEAGGRNTFSMGHYGSNETLFQAGESFTASAFASFFPNQGNYNDGSALPSSISIDTLDSNGVTISIRF